MITISLISHGHGKMINVLVKQLIKSQLIQQIIVICNIPESINLPTSRKIHRINNYKPYAFSKNHNFAFKHCTQPFFCILNPDIEFKIDPFPLLLETIESLQAALISPLITSARGEPEDSIRHFPTVRSLLSKLIFGSKGQYPTSNNQVLTNPDWIAGMFMLFRSKDFHAINMFDERYYLYYEDVDICARLHKANKAIIVDLRVTVVHHAQRQSHKSLRHMSWHLTSMIRYLWSYK